MTVTKSKMLTLQLVMVLAIAMPLLGGSHPKYFVVLPGAADVKETKSNGQEQLFYKLTCEFPAGTVINAISSALGKEGWGVLKEDFLNPGLRNSNNPELPKVSISKETELVLSWSWFLDGTTNPETFVYSWNGQWQNKSGDILTYVLRYRDVYDQPYHAPTHAHTIKPKSKTLEVIAILIPADLAKEMKQWSSEFHKSKEKQ